MKGDEANDIDYFWKIEGKASYENIPIVGVDRFTQSFTKSSSISPADREAKENGRR